jgi:thiamine pyrophosphate-dependent acetolactate synthase large subunit-like protein
LGAQVDLVVAIGSSVNYYTVDGGNMYPKAEIVQIDIEPRGLSGGMKAANLHLRLDAKLAAVAKRLRERGRTKAAIRTPGLARRIKEEPADARHGIKLLMCILNDGVYGAEIHKLRHDRIDDSGAIFGRTDFAAIAKGFGLRGTNVTDLSELKPLFDAYQAQDKAEIWNIHVSDTVVNPSTQRGVRRGHGKMLFSVLHFHLAVH